jgi:hypothetical protein
MDNWNQQLIDVLMKSRGLKQKQGRESKAASLTTGVNKPQLIHNLIFS